MMPLEHEKKIRQAHIAREVIEVVLLVLVISFAIKLSIDTRTIIGDSMKPSLPPGQLVMVNKIAYVFGSPQRGDVIVLYYPLDTSQAFIKRIVGLPGDTIQVSPTNVTVNGHLISEPYILEPVNSTVGTVTLGPSEYWVMGDNRRVSCDSRSWGVLDRKYIIGKVTFVYWPAKDIHGVNTHSDAFTQISDVKPTKGATTFVASPNGCQP